MKTLHETANDLNCTEAEKRAICKRLDANDQAARMAMASQRSKQETGKRGGSMYEAWLRENGLAE